MGSDGVAGREVGRASYCFMGDLLYILSVPKSLLCNPSSEIRPGGRERKRATLQERPMDESYPVSRQPFVACCVSPGQPSVGSLE